MTLQSKSWPSFDTPQRVDIEVDEAQRTSISFCLYSAEKDSIRSDQRLGPQEMAEINEAAAPVFEDSDLVEEILVIFKRTAPPFGNTSTDPDGSRETAARKLRLAYLLRRCADRLDRSL